MHTSTSRRIPQLKVAIKECRALAAEMKAIHHKRDENLARKVLNFLECELIEAMAAEALVDRRKGQVIHHIDGDLRNNEISNLRIVTVPENGR